MQLQIEFEPVHKIQFWSQKGANYARFHRSTLKRDIFGLLIPGNKYSQIGSKRRTQFCWNPAATYDGIVSNGIERFIVFNAGQHKDDPNDCIAYAFIIVESCKVPTVLQFNEKMNACRDIVIDAVE